MSPAWQIKGDVPDVDTVPCPARTDGPHEVRAGKPGPGRYADDPVWQCQHCRCSWADLDAQIRASDAVRRQMAKRIRSSGGDA